MRKSKPQDMDRQALIETNRRLERAVAELAILNDLAREIGASTNSEEIMRKIVRNSLRAVNAEQGVVTLVGRDARDPATTLVRSVVSSCDHSAFHINDSLLGWMHCYQEPLIMNDPGNDSRFRGVRWEDSIHSLLCVPLMLKSELTGILAVFNKRSQGVFDQEDRRLLTIIAAQSAQVIENARLSEKEKTLRRMQEEVRIASVIQRDLLPGDSPKIPGYDVAGKSIPAQMVGCDYFDFIPFDAGCLAFCVADVSGKGLPASLLMANVQATLRGQAQLNPSPCCLIANSKTLLFRSTDSGKFVTLFFGILDPKEHKIRYANGGHNCPLFFSGDGDPVRLEAIGMMLGFLESFEFQEKEITVHPGDCIVVYSDGITEATNCDGEQFEEDRLIRLIQNHRNDTPKI